jgi:AbiV family abortive infection protein
MTGADFPFSWKGCKDGADVCLENANRLLQDACLLFEKERYIASSCLAILTIEEIGKGIELLGLFRTQEDLSKSKWEKLSKGKAHIRKIMAGQELVHEYLEKQFKNIRLMKAKIDEQAKLTLAKHYQWRKERYLYVDLVNNRWVSPATRSAKSQAVLASMELAEAFEGCIALGKALGRDTTDHEKRYDRFATASMKVVDKSLEVPDD